MRAGVIGGVAACLVLTLSASGAPTEESDGRLQLTASVRPAPRHETSSGGDFELRAEVAPTELSSLGGDFTFTVPGGGGGDAVEGSCGCLCTGSEIFSDAFESGNTDNWSDTVPTTG